MRMTARLSMVARMPPEFYPRRFRTESRLFQPDKLINHRNVNQANRMYFVNVQGRAPCAVRSNVKICTLRTNHRSAYLSIIQGLRCKNVLY